MKKTYIFFVFVIVIFLTIAVIANSNIDFSRLLGSVSNSSDDTKMVVHVIDYGDGQHGDAVLIESKGNYLLMDSGGYSPNNTVPCCYDLNTKECDKDSKGDCICESSNRCIDNQGIHIINYLKKIGVKKFDIYISHYDHDHITNFYHIINYKENGTPYFEIDNIYLPNIEGVEMEYARIPNNVCNTKKADGTYSDECLYKVKIAKILGLGFTDINNPILKAAYGGDASGANKYDNYYFADNTRAFWHYVLADKITSKKRPSNVKHTPTYITTGFSKTFGDAKLEVIFHKSGTSIEDYTQNYPNNYFYKNYDNYLAAYANNLSLVSMITAGGKKFLSAGDIQWDIEQEILSKVNKGQLSIKADLMKLSHHGNETSNFIDFYNAVSPSYVFYQSGHESAYKNSLDANGNLVVNYVGLRTYSGTRENIFENKTIKYMRGNGTDINQSLNVSKINNKVYATTPHYANSPVESGSFKYVFKNDGTITRQCATTDCKRKSITIKFDKNDNTDTGQAKQLFITDINEPYKFGYTESGSYKWKVTDSFGFGSWKWESNSSSSTCTTGKCALAGWSLSKNGSINHYTYSNVRNTWIEKMITDSKDTLYAVWKPLYTYNLNNQSATTAGTKTINGVKDTANDSGYTGIFLGSIEKPMTERKNPITKPTKTNYEFMGYYTKTNGEGTQLINSDGNVTTDFVITNTSYQKDLTLYAYWKPVQYTVEVKVTNGTGGTSKKVDYNTTTTFNNIKANTGYGSPSVSCTNSQTATLSGTTLTTGKITNNTVCTVKYSLNKYSVILNVVNGSGTSTQSISHGTTATFKNISPNTGYGNRQVSCDNSTYTFSGTTLTTGQITKKTTCSVSYSATTYTITYALNDGTVSGTNPGTYNVNTATFTLINPTKKGYTFSGWTGTGLSKKTTTVKVTKGSTGNRTYTANYDAISYPITYNLNGGSLPSGKTNPSSYTVTTETFTLNNPTKDGYTFSGWTWTGHTTPTKSVSIQKGTVGAKEYTANYTPKEYTVTFNANGGSVSTTSKKVTYESTYGTLPTPTWTGHSFSGWYTEKDGGTKVTSSTKVTNVGNHTLYAHWGLSKYTVEVKVVNGTGATSKQVEYNKTTTFIVSPNSGYGNGNVSCTNSQTASLSGTTLTTGKITGNTTCTITYQKDSEPSIVIKDTTNLSLSGNNIITKLPTGTTKMTKQNFLSKITTTGEWKVYNKSNNEITSNTATITTGSSIKSGTKEYKIVILGDIDQNGEVTVADLYQSYLLFKNRAGSLTDIQKAAADYDKNNKYDLTDLFNIYKKMKNK